MVNIPLVTTLGYTAALVVFVAVCAAVTLLPALLGIVGDRIDALALPHRKAADDHPHGWARWARFVARRPLPSALVAVVVLAALALPTLDLYLGQQDNGALPTGTDARRAYDGLTSAFGVGANGPLLISVDIGAEPASADTAKISWARAGVSPGQRAGGRRPRAGARSPSGRAPRAPGSARARAR